MKKAKKKPAKKKAKMGSLPKGFDLGGKGKKK